MSNEKDNTNRPRRLQTAKSSRVRKFSCISYLNELQLKSCLVAHLSQIRVYAYAYHDKDIKEDGTLKEPHFHLIIVTYNTCTLSAIRRWFSGFVDSGGEITTTAQVCGDVYEMYDYLTHNTLAAKAQNKYQYDSDIIQTNDLNYFRASPESEYDNITLACEMLLKGASTRECGLKFGRDFILHYGAIRTYLNDIYQWEHKDIKDLGDILETEW